MKHSLKFTFILTLSILATGMWATKAFAQTPASTKMANELTEIMDCELGLTQAQFKMVYDINYLSLQNLTPFSPLSIYGNNMRHVIGKAADQKRNAALKKTLTTHQYTIYRKISKGNKRILRQTALCRHRNPDNAGLESCLF